ncbi:MAG: S-methyl-5-thioribose-1-phosphate isomerase [Bianqueaceae bacterium]
MDVCRRLGEYGLSLLQDGDGILTTAMPANWQRSNMERLWHPSISASSGGMHFHVYTDETRPLLQGIRLSAFEMQAAGVKTTVLCDNMASSVMQRGWVQAVLVGCDRVAANGDTANKIGTSGVAILANYYHIPFYVVAPTSTIDLTCPSGTAIPIEQRPPEEVTHMWYEASMAPAGVDVYNPAFDVTDHSLITAIVTEYGIAYPPYDKSLAALCSSSTE